MSYVVGEGKTFEEFSFWAFLHQLLFVEKRMGLELELYCSLGPCILKRREKEMRACHALGYNLDLIPCRSCRL